MPDRSAERAADLIALRRLAGDALQVAEPVDTAPMIAELERLAAALIVPKHRVATRPSKSARRKRVTTKRHRGETKQARRRPGTDD